MTLAPKKIYIVYFRKIVTFLQLMMYQARRKIFINIIAANSQNRPFKTCYFYYFYFQIKKILNNSSKEWNWYQHSKYFLKKYSQIKESKANFKRRMVINSITLITFQTTKMIIKDQDFKNL